MMLGPAGCGALGVLVLVGQAAGESSGSGTLLAVFSAATLSLLAGECKRQKLQLAFPVQTTMPRKDVPAFATLWLGLLRNIAALAATARALSSTMGYISMGQSWLHVQMGSFQGSDLLALAATLVPSILFVLGLENSNVLQLLLTSSLAAITSFFLIVGAPRADAGNWTHDGLLASGFSGVSMLTTQPAVIRDFDRMGKNKGRAVVTATAIMMPTFLGIVHGQGSRLSLSGHFLVTLLSCCTIAVITTLMVNYRELHHNSVPLLIVFEVRDVDWARLVMAVLSVLGLALTLLEVCPVLHTTVATLASDEWRILPKCLSKDHPVTATALFAILASAAPAALLTSLCPLWLLAQLISLPVVLDHAVQAVTLVALNYQPISSTSHRKLGATRNYRFGRNPTLPAHLQEEHPEPHKMTVKCLKSGLTFLPAAIQAKQKQVYSTLSSPNDSSSINITYLDPDSNSNTLGQMDTTRYNLSNGSVTSLKSIESMLLDEEEAPYGESTCGSSTASDEEEIDSSSTTDIDAIVAEYKERIKVATTQSITSRLQEPTLATEKRVTLAMGGVVLGAAQVATCLAVSSTGSSGSITVVALGLAAIFCLLCLIAHQPQNKKRLLIPWLPAAVLLMQAIMAAQLLAATWLPALLWLPTGCALYWKRDGWWKGRTGIGRERIRLHAPPRHSMVSTLIPSHRYLPDEHARRLTQVDTILISR